MLPGHNTKPKVTSSTESDTLAQKLLCALSHVFLPVFCCLFGWFFRLIVLYWVSAHPWHCDLLCCFIWHLSIMQLVVTALFISILYEQSQYLFENIAQLLRGSFQITWNFSLYFSGCLVLSAPVLSIRQKNLTWQILLRCLGRWTESKGR